jgi:hypothetical protein
MCLLLLLCAAPGFCASKEVQFDCSELGPGATQTYFETFPVRNKFVTQIKVTIDASNVGTAGQPKCHVKRTVTATSAGRSRVLFTYADDPQFDTNGAALDGVSPDGSKLLLDFFTAAGDYTGHRPVVYDFLTSRWTLRDVGTRVTSNLPKCDYSTLIDSVTNDGNVILYVPKSMYVDQGCPDQGQWLLDMEADTITRLDKAHASLKAQSPR